MSTLTGKDLNLVKPALTDDHKVTIGTDLPANFQKIDDEFTRHQAETVSQANGVHGLKMESGTWTPEVDGEGTSGTVTYTTQAGSYTRVGNLVKCHFNLGFKMTGGSGAIVIKGLPFNLAGFHRGIGTIAISLNNDTNEGLGIASAINSGYQLNAPRLMINTGETAQISLINIDANIILAGDFIYTI